MRLKKIRARGKEFRAQNFFNAGQVNLGVFGEGMVAVHQERRQAEQRQEK